MRWIAFPAGVLLVVAGCDEWRPRHTISAADSAALMGAALDSAPSRPAPVHSARVPALGSADADVVFRQMTQALRRLVVAEETHFAENGTYTSDFQRMGIRPPENATIDVLWATRDGWAARGTHPAIPGMDCVVYVGVSRPAPATRRYRRHAPEGTPVCDTSPEGVKSPPAAPAEAPDTGSALEAVSPVVQMKVDLRNLARSQELWFGTQGAYSRRVEPFAMQYLWHRGVTVTILHANRVSWSAKATHTDLPGKSCVIWYGSMSSPPRTDFQRRRAAQAAVPVCDDSA